MRLAFILMVVAGMVTAAGWNVNMVCDALIAIYQNGTVRQGIAALVVMAREPKRVIDDDFEDEVKRQIERNW